MKGRKERRIVVEPQWRENPDARLYALAVVELIRKQAAEQAKKKAEAPSTEPTND